MAVNENYSLIIQVLDSVLAAYEKAVTMLKSGNYGNAFSVLNNINLAFSDLQDLLQASYGDKNSALYRIADCREQIQSFCTKLQQDVQFDEANANATCEEIGKLIRKIRILVDRSEGIHDEGEFKTVVYRPKRADELGIRSDKRTTKKTAIVIQGPIKYEDDFTLETVKIYKMLYPECQIIVSTWEDERNRAGELLGGEDVILCFSSKPLHAGYGNSAFQTISSRKGVDKALELGCERICKTRTDQRFYNPNLFYELEKLLELFPVEKGTAQKERVICISTTTDKNRLYNICDMFVYGDADDVNRYFSCPLDERDYDSTTQVVWTNAAEFARQRFAEEWFVTHFIESLGYELKWTYEDSDYYRNKLFMIIDASLLDFVWMKYNNDEYKDRYYNSQKPLVPSYVGFLEWLSEQ